MFSISTPITAWLVVCLSGLLEIVFSVAMQFSNGYTRLAPSLLSLAAATLSVWLMSRTLQVLPLGTAYAVWAGIGAAGTALVGIVWLGEPANLGRLVCMGVVIAGIVGLQLQSPA